MSAQKTTFFLLMFLMVSYSVVMAGGSGSTTPPRTSGSSQGSNQALSAPNKAYGDNMKEVEPGVFAIYSGDVNQDGYIATDDVTTVDNDNLVGAIGNYLVTDLNGDTYVGTDDVTLCDNNNLSGIQIQRP